MIDFHALIRSTIRPMIKRLCLLCFLAAPTVGLTGCSGDDTKIDYKVTFSDGAGKDKGIVDSGSFNTIQASAPSKALAGSMATLEIKSDTAGLHFVILESVTDMDGMTMTFRMTRRS